MPTQRFPSRTQTTIQTAAPRRQIRALLDGPEREKVKSASTTLNALANREAADTEPLTEQEWKDLRAADTHLKEALGESTQPTTAQVFSTRARMAATARALSGVRR